MKKIKCFIYICRLDLCVGNFLFLAPENKEKSKYRQLHFRKCLGQWCLCGPGARCGHSRGRGPGLGDGCCSGPGREEGYTGGEGHEGAWQDSGGAAAAWRSQGSQRSGVGRSVKDAAHDLMAQQLIVRWWFVSWFVVSQAQLEKLILLILYSTNKTRKH